MGKQHLRVTLLIILFISILSFYQTAKAESITEDTLQDIYDRGYILIGADPTYPPFESYNSETNEVEGFDIDLAHQLAISLGIQVKMKSTSWDLIIPNLIDVKYDVILSAITITEPREEVVDFTRWYYKFYQAILVVDGNPLGMATEADLNASLTIGVQTGTKTDFWAQENLNSSVTLTSFDTILLAIAALKQGSIDVVLGDYAVLAQDEANSGETQIVNIFAPESLGIACRSGDDNLRVALNDAINDLLGSDVNNPNPTDLYNTIYYKWFGVSAWDMGYTGYVTDLHIPYVWYEELSTTTTTDISTTQDSSAITTDPTITPGFSVFLLIYAFPVFLWYQKKNDRRK